MGGGLLLIFSSRVWRLKFKVWDRFFPFPSLFKELKLWSFSSHIKRTPERTLPDDGVSERRKLTVIFNKQMLNEHLNMPGEVQQKSREPERASFNNMNTKSGNNHILCALESDAKDRELKAERWGAESWRRYDGTWARKLSDEIGPIQGGMAVDARKLSKDTRQKADWQRRGQAGHFSGGTEDGGEESGPLGRYNWDRRREH